MSVVQLGFSGTKILPLQKRLRQVEVRIFEIGRVAERNRGPKPGDAGVVLSQHQMGDAKKEAGVGRLGIHVGSDAQIVDRRSRSRPCDSAPCHAGSAPSLRRARRASSAARSEGVRIVRAVRARAPAATAASGLEAAASRVAPAVTAAGVLRFGDSSGTGRIHSVAPTARTIAAASAAAGAHPGSTRVGFAVEVSDARGSSSRMALSACSSSKQRAHPKIVLFERVAVLVAQGPAR